MIQQKSVNLLMKINILSGHHSGNSGLALLSTGDRCSYLSFSINLMKSLCGGFGIRPIQEQRESSSDPNPLYGGTGLGTALPLSALYAIGLNSSVEEDLRNYDDIIAAFGLVYLVYLSVDYRLMIDEGA